MKNKIPTEVTKAATAYLSAIGTIGGKNGVGKNKRRPAAHYLRMAKLSAEARRKKALDR